jgi:hypothetical protein
MQKCENSYLQANERDGYRQALAEAWKSEERGAKQWGDQCKAAQLIPWQLYPPTTVIWDEKGRRIGEPYVSPAPSSYGTPVPDGRYVEQHALRTRPWILPTLSYHLTPAPDWTSAMLSADIRAMDHPDIPPLTDEVVLARLFVIPLIERFDQLDFAQDWRWHALEVEDDPAAMTYTAAIREKWCSAKNARELKQRFARFKYRAKYITPASYFRLEELEVEARSLELAYAKERRREQAAKRQARRQAKLSKDLKAQIRLKDRQRKQPKNSHSYFHPVSVTENAKNKR